MEKQNVMFYDSFFEIDRMINEGLGGGFINSEYAETQMELEEQKAEVDKSQTGCDS
ncbi:hypothetical protein [Virgibacillus sp. DJP39]|uniref:hypothetical protein n=1 Tax=Virgibacillus sp. DJP39 TaxID=3409790 RepID=UPI003BB77281